MLGRIENWRPVLGYEGRYEVSDHGNVRGLDRIDGIGRRIKGRVLKAKPDGRKHLRVALCQNGEITDLSIHRVVLDAFKGACPEGMEGCHNNGDGCDNRLANLRWDTRANNHADKKKHGTMLWGERHPNSKITAECVLRMKDLRRSGQTWRAIGDWFGVSLTLVRMVVLGKTWKHLNHAG